MQTKAKTIITSDQTEFRLKAGELYFHKPNEFHAVRSDGQIAPNLIVISFDLSVSNKSDLQLSSENSFLRSQTAFFALTRQSGAYLLYYSRGKAKL